MKTKKVTKKDELLKKIYLYKEVSSEGMYLLGGSYYVEKLKKELLSKGFIKKSSLKPTKKTAIRAGVSYKIQSYYVTPKGKKHLADIFPDEFATRPILPRKLSNDAVERLVKISDSAIMAETAGAYIVNQDYFMENDPLSAATSQAAVVSDYGAADKEELKGILKQHIAHGVFLSANEAKKSFNLTDDDVKQYKFTSITGILLAPNNPYCLYHCGNGFLSQRKLGEEKIASSIMINFAIDYGLYPRENVGIKVKNSIVFCKNISAFAKLVLNKYNVKNSLTGIFANAYVIPVSLNGSNIIKRFIKCPGYKKELVELLKSEYGYKEHAGLAAGNYPVENESGEAVFVGIDFHLNGIRMLINSLDNEDYAGQNFSILCFEWQEEYYKELISLLNTKRINIQTLDEEVLDETLGFTDRVPAIKERKRRPPTYSRNSLFGKKPD